VLRDTYLVRASGLQGDASSEIIAILDDDTNAFGDRAPSRPVSDTEGPRWVGPAAAAALVALIGYGVATSASTNGTSKAAPATSASAAPTTTGPTPPSTTISPPATPAYIAEPPPGFTPVYAERIDAVSYDPVGIDSVGPANKSYELWGTADASAASGRWFAVDIEQYAQPSTIADNAYRTSLGQLPVVVSFPGSGRTAVSFAPIPNFNVTVTSFGWAAQELSRLVTGIGLLDGKPTYADTWFTADHSKLSTVAPWIDMFRQPAEQLVYSSADGTQYIGIGVSPQTANQGDRATRLRFLLDYQTPFEVDGHSAIAGQSVSGSFSMATWVDDDNVITITGSFPTTTPQLIAFARTVRQVPETEWGVVQAQAQGHPIGNDTTFEANPPKDVSFGIDADGQPWTIEVQTSVSGPLRSISWQSSGSGWGGQPTDDTAKITTHIEGLRTYITAELPRVVVPTAELHIMGDGLDPVVVPFNDVDSALDRTFAAYAFSEPVPYTAEIVGPDGTVLATWPSP
jgi:hypothetical protein